MRLLLLPAVNKKSFVELKYLVLGARPRTLFVSIAPVILGTALSASAKSGLGSLSLVKFILCMFISVSLQIATNYANDYSDGIKGVDNERLGPQRLTSSGLVKPKTVKTLAAIFFLLAALAGLVLSIITTPYLLVVGLFCILAGIFYTGGPVPYGYYGLGEAFVFMFFGLVATVGSGYVQNLHFKLSYFIAGILTGALSSSVLVANNLRDIEQDKRSKKYTLAVYLGKIKTQHLYSSLVFLSVISIVVLSFAAQKPVLLFGLVPACYSFVLVKGAYRYRLPSDLITLLKYSSLYELVLSIALAGIYLA